jgi:protease-4
MEKLSGEAKASMLKSELGDLYPMLHKMEKIKSWNGIQTRLPFEMEIN